MSTVFQQQNWRQNKTIVIMRSGKKMKKVCGAPLLSLCIQASFGRMERALHDFLCSQGNCCKSDITSGCYKYLWKGTTQRQFLSLWHLALHKAEQVVILVHALALLGSLAGALLSTRFFISMVSFVFPDHVGLDVHLHRSTTVQIL